MGSVFLIFLMAMQGAGGDKLQPLTTLTVCDVLASDPTRLNGKVIKVRGILAETDEGIWIIDKCKKHLATKGLEWRDALSVYVDSSDEGISRSLDEYWTETEATSRTIEARRHLHHCDWSA